MSNEALLVYIKSELAQFLFYVTNHKAEFSPGNSQRKDGQLTIQKSDKGQHQQHTEERTEKSQQCWLAVPSIIHLKGRSSPKEKVTWDDTFHFICLIPQAFQNNLDTATSMSLILSAIVCLPIICFHRLKHVINGPLYLCSCEFCF